MGLSEMNYKKNTNVLNSIWKEREGSHLICPQCKGTLTMIQMDPIYDTENPYTPYKTIIECDLFIGMESSGLHLAIMGRIPTIGIVGGGHYGRFVPWVGVSAHQIFLTSKMECFNCNWNCRTNKFECIQNVSPEEVAENADKLLHA